MPNFTKQAIKASFMKLLNEQPLSKISVRSIVEDCGINRNSFYYHFQDIPTLLGEIVREYVDELIEKYQTVNSLDECVTIAFSFALENKRAVFHIYNSVNRDIYETSTLKLAEYVVTTYIDTVYADADVSPRDRSIAIRFMKCALFGMCIDWVENGMDEDAINNIHRLNELLRGVPEEILARMKEK